MSGRGPRWFTGIKYPYEDNFADNTWAQIIAACQRKAVPSTWKVADQKTMTINGADYLIDIIGLNHDNYADGSGKAPITFQMHDCYGEAYAMNNGSSNVGSWRDSIMRTIRLTDILLLMPPEVQSAIHSVLKKTSAGNKATNIVTTSDGLFLLSEVEIQGQTTYSASGEGTKYEYYNATNRRQKTLKDGTSNVNWLTRSPRSTQATQFCTTSGAGDAYYASASAKLGVSFAFCF